MARTIAPLPQKSVGEAIAYLKRALQRNNSGIFLTPSQATAELTRLEALLKSVPEKNVPHCFLNWGTDHLSAKGRIKMLNALRRRKADGKPGRAKRTTLTISDSTQKELKLLVQKTGVPLPKLLASLAAVANVNEEMCAQVIKLAIAQNMKPQKSRAKGPSNRGNPGS